MLANIEYVFPSEAVAYRFLNTVTGLYDDAKVKYGQSAYHVYIEYPLASGSFDNRLASLDELAQSMEGCES